MLVLCIILCNVNFFTYPSTAPPLRSLDSMGKRSLMRTSCMTPMTKPVSAGFVSPKHITSKYGLVRLNGCRETIIPSVFSESVKLLKNDSVYLVICFHVFFLTYMICTTFPLFCSNSKKRGENNERKKRKEATLRIKLSS